MHATSANILLVDDDVRLAQMLTAYLGENGFSVRHVGTGEAGVEHVLSHFAGGCASALAPALVILDWMLPDTDGLSVCQRIRQLSGIAAQLPVLMLTAKGDPFDRVLGLEMGADDYLPKPFEPRELLARMRALLRRSHIASTGKALGIAGPEAGQGLRFGRLEIDRDAREVRLLAALGAEHSVCELTAYQFDLLCALAERAGRVLTREQIMEAVRGKELEAFDRSIDVHMGRIRQAIEDDPKNPQRILTVRGVGYVFAKQQA